MKLYKKILKAIKKAFYQPFAKNAENKIILMVDGGLASQIHKYLLGLYFEKIFNVPIEYDLTWFEKSGKSIDKKENRLFQLLEVFPDIEFKIAKKSDIALFKACFRYINQTPFFKDEKLFSLKPPLYLDGYYIIDEAINYEACSDLKPNVTLSTENKEILNKIETHQASVAMHIRRGDYVDSCHDVLTPEYFVRTVEHMNKELAPLKPKYFIFSNGFDWVEEKVVPLLPMDTDFEFVNNSNDKGYYDFYLMSKCKYHIISNSMFGFYAAFLNKNTDKKVITPKEWMKKEYLEQNNSCNPNSEEKLSFPGCITMSVYEDILSGTK